MDIDSEYDDDSNSEVDGDGDGGEGGGEQEDEGEDEDEVESKSTIMYVKDCYVLEVDRVNITEAISGSAQNTYGYLTISARGRFSEHPLNFCRVNVVHLFGQ